MSQASSCGCLRLGSVQAGCRSPDPIKCVVPLTSPAGPKWVNWRRFRSGRARPRGDSRPASDPQIRRVFALARVAGLTGADGRADRDKVCQLVHRVAGVDEPDPLTREQAQDVYDELEWLIDDNEQRPTAL